MIVGINFLQVIFMQITLDPVLRAILPAAAVAAAFASVGGRAVGRVGGPAVVVVAD